MRLLVLVLSVLLIGGSRGTAEELPVRIFGEGTSSCTEWLQYRAYNTVMGPITEAWVRGFLTGMNAADLSSHSIGRGVTPITNNIWLDNYCSQHPLEKLYNAALALRAALRDAGRE